MKSSTLVALGATIDILRSLLEEEDLSLAQLTYVVEHIHTPLLQGSDPSSQSHSHHKKQEKQQLDASSISASPILTFAQHWELFANIVTLHASQAVLRRQLEVALRECTALLEQQQQWYQLHAEDIGAAVESRNSGRATRRDEADDEIDEEGVLDATNAVIVSLCSILREVFCSPMMQHYIAEHMMYSLNYSRNIAPRVLDIARLWATQNKAQGTAYKQHTPVAPQRSTLNSEERRRLKQYIPLLRFLWSELGGETGMPSHRYTFFVHLAETPLRWTAPTTKKSPQTQEQQLSARAHASRTNRVAGAMGEMPPLPGLWRGFETLLALLATPLASLRRYIHVGHCLTQSQCLPRSIRRTLQTEFFDMATDRVVDESSIVLEELANQGVAHILSLIDEIPPAFDGSKKPAGTHPGTNGSRVLVHYGRITKRYRRGRHERLMFLFSDWLCYVEEQVNNRMRLRGSIPLNSVKVVELEDIPLADVFNAFKIVSSDTSLTFFAPTPEQKQQWVAALRSTAQLYQRLTGELELQKPSGDVTRAVRPAAPPLTQSSRLRRQQCADAHENARIDHRRLDATASVRMTTQLSGTMQKQSLKEKPSKAKEAVTRATSGAAKERAEGETPSVVRGHWRPTHESFNVTHWAKQSTDTVHVRIRSADLLSFPQPTAEMEREVGGGIVRNEKSSMAAHVDCSPLPQGARLVSERLQKSNVSPAPPSSLAVQSSSCVFPVMSMPNEGGSGVVLEGEETDGTVDMKASGFFILKSSGARGISADEDDLSVAGEDAVRTTTPRGKGSSPTGSSPEPRIPLSSTLPVPVRSSRTNLRISSACSDSEETLASVEFLTPTTVPTQRHMDPTVGGSVKKKCGWGI